MSNTFWSVFFGVSASILSLSVIQSVIDDFMRKRRKQEIEDVLNQLEDFEADDED